MITLLLLLSVFFIPLLDSLLLHLPSFVDSIVSIVLVVAVFELPSIIFVGASSEQTFSFPFPVEAVFNAVPKAIGHSRWRLWGKIVGADNASSAYVIKIGWSRWAGVMKVNLTKLDDKNTKVHVLYESKAFIDLGSARRLTDLFLRILYGSLIGADPRTFRRLTWRM